MEQIENASVNTVGQLRLKLLKPISMDTIIQKTISERKDPNLNLEKPAKKFTAEPDTHARKFSDAEYIQSKTKDLSKQSKLSLVNFMVKDNAAQKRNPFLTDMKSDLMKFESLMESANPSLALITGRGFLLNNKVNVQNYKKLSEIDRFNKSIHLKWMTNMYENSNKTLFIQNQMIAQNENIAKMMDRKLDAIKVNTGTSELSKITLLGLGAFLLKLKVAQRGADKVEKLVDDKIINPLMKYIDDTFGDDIKAIKEKLGLKVEEKKEKILNSKTFKKAEEKAKSKAKDIRNFVISDVTIKDFLKEHKYAPSLDSITNFISEHTPNMAKAEVEKLAIRVLTMAKELRNNDRRELQKLLRETSDKNTSFIQNQRQRMLNNKKIKEFLEKVGDNLTPENVSEFITDNIPDISEEEREEHNEKIIKMWGDYQDTKKKNMNKLKNVISDKVISYIDDKRNKLENNREINEFLDKMGDSITYEYIEHFADEKLGDVSAEEHEDFVQKVFNMWTKRQDKKKKGKTKLIEKINKELNNTKSYIVEPKKMKDFVISVGGKLTSENVINFISNNLPNASDERKRKVADRLFKIRDDVREKTKPIEDYVINKFNKIKESETVKSAQSRALGGANAAVDGTEKVINKILKNPKINKILKDRGFEIEDIDLREVLSNEYDDVKKNLKALKDDPKEVVTRLIREEIQKTKKTLGGVKNTATDTMNKMSQNFSENKEINKFLDSMGDTLIYEYIEHFADEKLGDVSAEEHEEFVQKVYQMWTKRQDKKESQKAKLIKKFNKEYNKIKSVVIEPKKIKDFVKSVGGNLTTENVINFVSNNIPNASEEQKKEVVDKLLAIRDKVKETIDPVTDYVSKQINNIQESETYKSAQSRALSGANATVNVIEKNINKLIKNPKIKRLLEDRGYDIDEVDLREIASKALSDLSEIQRQDVIDAFINFKNKVKSGVLEGYDDVKDNLKAFRNDPKAVTERLLREATQKTQKTLGGIKNTATDTVNKMSQNFSENKEIKEFLDVMGDHLTYEDIEYFAAEKLGDVSEEEFEQLVQKVSDMWTKRQDRKESQKIKLTEKLSEELNKVKSYIVEPQKIKDFVTSVGGNLTTENVVNFVSNNLPNVSEEKKKEVVDKLLAARDKVKEKIEPITDYVSKQITNIRESERYKRAESRVLGVANTTIDQIEKGINKIITNPKVKKALTERGYDIDEVDIREIASKALSDLNEITREDIINSIIKMKNTAKQSLLEGYDDVKKNVNAFRDDPKAVTERIVNETIQKAKGASDFITRHTSDLKSKGQNFISERIGQFDENKEIKEFLATMGDDLTYEDIEYFAAEKLGNVSDEEFEDFVEKVFDIWSNRKDGKSKLAERFNRLKESETFKNAQSRAFGVANAAIGSTEKNINAFMEILKDKKDSSVGMINRMSENFSNTKEIKEFLDTMGDNLTEDNIFDQIDLFVAMKASSDKHEGKEVTDEQMNDLREKVFQMWYEKNLETNEEKFKRISGDYLKRASRVRDSVIDKLSQTNVGKFAQDQIDSLKDKILSKDEMINFIKSKGDLLNVNDVSDFVRSRIPNIDREKLNKYVQQIYELKNRLRNDETPSNDGSGRQPSILDDPRDGSGPADEHGGPDIFNNINKNIQDHKSKSEVFYENALALFMSIDHHLYNVSGQLSGGSGGGGGGEPYPTGFLAGTRLFLRNSIRNSKNILKGGGKMLGNYYSFLGRTIKGGIGSLYGILKNVVGGIVKLGLKPVKGLARILFKAGSPIFSIYKTIFKTAGNVFTYTMKGIADALNGKDGNLLSQLLRGLGKTAVGAVKGIFKMVKGIGSWYGSIVKNVTKASWSGLERIFAKGERFNLEKTVGRRIDRLSRFLKRSHKRKERKDERRNMRLTSRLDKIYSLLHSSFSKKGNRNDLDGDGDDDESYYDILQRRRMAAQGRRDDRDDSDNDRDDDRGDNNSGFNLLGLVGTLGGIIGKAVEKALDFGGQAIGGLSGVVGGVITTLLGIKVLKGLKSGLLGLSKGIVTSTLAMGKASAGLLRGLLSAGIPAVTPPGAPGTRNTRAGSRGTRILNFLKVLNYKKALVGGALAVGAGGLIAASGSSAEADELGISEDDDGNLVDENGTILMYKDGTLNPDYEEVVGGDTTPPEVMDTAPTLNYPGDTGSNNTSPNVNIPPISTAFQSSDNAGGLAFSAGVAPIGIRKLGTPLEIQAVKNASRAAGHGAVRTGFKVASRILTKFVPGLNLIFLGLEVYQAAKYFIEARKRREPNPIFVEASKERYRVAYGLNTLFKDEEVKLKIKDAIDDFEIDLYNRYNDYNDNQNVGKIERDFKTVNEYVKEGKVRAQRGRRNKSIPAIIRNYITLNEKITGAIKENTNPDFIKHYALHAVWVALDYLTLKLNTLPIELIFEGGWLFKKFIDTNIDSTPMTEDNFTEAHVMQIDRFLIAFEKRIDGDYYTSKIQKLKNEMSEDTKEQSQDTPLKYPSLPNNAPPGFGTTPVANKPLLLSSAETVTPLHKASFSPSNTTQNTSTYVAESGIWIDNPVDATKRSSNSRMSIYNASFSGERQDSQEVLKTIGGIQIGIKIPDATTESSDTRTSNYGEVLETAGQAGLNIANRVAMSNASKAFTKTLKSPILRLALKGFVKFVPVVGWVLLAEDIYKAWTYLSEFSKRNHIDPIFKKVRELRYKEGHAVNKLFKDEQLKEKVKSEINDYENKLFNRYNNYIRNQNVGKIQEDLDMITNYVKEVDKISTNMRRNPVPIILYTNFAKTLAKITEKDINSDFVKKYALHVTKTALHFLMTKIMNLPIELVFEEAGFLKLFTTMKMDSFPITKDQFISDPSYIESVDRFLVMFEDHVKTGIFTRVLDKLKSDLDMETDADKERRYWDTYADLIRTLPNYPPPSVGSSPSESEALLASSYSGSTFHSTDHYVADSGIWIVNGATKYTSPAYLVNASIPGLEVTPPRDPSATLSATDNAGTKSNFDNVNYRFDSALFRRELGPIPIVSGDIPKAKLEELTNRFNNDYKIDGSGRSIFSKMRKLRYEQGYLLSDGYYDVIDVSNKRELETIINNYEIELFNHFKETDAKESRYAILPIKTYTAEVLFPYVKENGKDINTTNPSLRLLSVFIDFKSKLSKALVRDEESEFMKEYAYHITVTYLKHLIIRIEQLPPMMRLQCINADSYPITNEFNLNYMVVIDKVTCEFEKYIYNFSGRFNKRKEKLIELSMKNTGDGTQGFDDSVSDNGVSTTVEYDTDSEDYSPLSAVRQTGGSRPVTTMPTSTSILLNPNTQRSTQSRMSPHPEYSLFTEPRAFKKMNDEQIASTNEMIANITDVSEIGKLFNKIIMHWTAGTYSAGQSITRYHFVVEDNGYIVKGVDLIKNVRLTHPGDISTYAAHTAKCNTKAIGISMASMAGADQNGSLGKYPFRPEQLASMIIFVAEMAYRFEIPITDKTVLTHAEVQPNLGLTQNGKWDIAVIPWDRSLDGAKPCGDYIRDLIRKARGKTIKEVLEMMGVKGTVPDDQTVEPPNFESGEITSEMRRLEEESARALRMNTNGNIPGGQPSRQTGTGTTNIRSTGTYRGSSSPGRWSPSVSGTTKLDLNQMTQDMNLTPLKVPLRGMVTMEYLKELTFLAVQTSNILGIRPMDLLTVIGYETGGTFDAWQEGQETEQFGVHRGLIQWGVPQRGEYGVPEGGLPLKQQFEAIVRYLIKAGVKPGMKLVNIYAGINAGNVNRTWASDAHNGGAPGTVSDKVREQMHGHKRKAFYLLQTFGYLTGNAQSVGEEDTIDDSGVIIDDETDSGPTPTVSMDAAMGSGIESTGHLEKPSSTLNVSRPSSPTRSNTMSSPVSTPSADSSPQVSRASTGTSQPVVSDSVSQPSEPSSDRERDAGSAKIFAIAQKYNGVKEDPRKGASNPIIDDMYKRTGLTRFLPNGDDTPWCAVFVGACLVEAGFPHSGSAMANSYDTWGIKVGSLNQCVPGDVVRVAWRSGGEHVAFYERHDQSYVYLYGGNQSNMVNTIRAPHNAIRALRRASGTYTGDFAEPIPVVSSATSADGYSGTSSGVLNAEDLVSRDSSYLNGGVGSLGSSSTTSSGYSISPGGSGHSGAGGCVCVPTGQIPSYGTSGHLRGGAGPSGVMGVAAITENGVVVPNDEDTTSIYNTRVGGVIDPAFMPSQDGSKPPIAYNEELDPRGSYDEQFAKSNEYTNKERVMKILRGNHLHASAYYRKVAVHGTPEQKQTLIDALNEVRPDLHDPRQNSSTVRFKEKYGFDPLSEDPEGRGFYDRLNENISSGRDMSSEEVDMRKALLNMNTTERNAYIENIRSNGTPEEVNRLMDVIDDLTKDLQTAGDDQSTTSLRPMARPDTSAGMSESLRPMARPTVDTSDENINKMLQSEDPMVVNDYVANVSQNGTLDQQKQVLNNVGRPVRGSPDYVPPIDDANMKIDPSTPYYELTDDQRHRLLTDPNSLDMDKLETQRTYKSYPEFSGEYTRNVTRPVRGSPDYVPDPADSPEFANYTSLVNELRTAIANNSIVNQESLFKAIKSQEKLVEALTKSTESTDKNTEEQKMNTEKIKENTEKEIAPPTVINNNNQSSGGGVLSNPINRRTSDVSLERNRGSDLLVQ